MRYSLKDNFTTIEGTPSFGTSSPIFELKGKYDSDVKSLMDNAGHTWTGYSKGTPFACGNLDHLVTIDGILAGGSSSGSAKAVLQRETDAGIGSDVGGSCRTPAIRAKLIGYKASSQEVPRRGLYRACSSMEGVGWITRTIEESEIVLNSLGQDLASETPWVNVRITDDLNLIESLGSAWLAEYLPQFYSNSLTFNGQFHKDSTQGFCKSYSKELSKSNRKNLSTLIKSRIFAGGALALDDSQARARAIEAYRTKLVKESPEDTLLITPAQP